MTNLVTKAKVWCLLQALEVTRHSGLASHYTQVAKIDCTSLAHVHQHYLCWEDSHVSFVLQRNHKTLQKKEALGKPTCSEMVRVSSLETSNRFAAPLNEMLCPNKESPRNNRQTKEMAQQKLAQKRLGEIRSEI